MRAITFSLFVGLSACAAGGGEGNGGGGEAGATNSTSSTGQGTTSSATTATGNMVSACISDTPCASDLQCTTLAGFACNDELPTPMCQRLSCGADVPCDGRDEFCAPDRVCRLVDHADGLSCLPETLGPQDCLGSCNTAPVESPGSCYGDPHAGCAAFCAKPNLCDDDGGLKYVESIYGCDDQGSFYSVDIGIRCMGGSRPTYSQQL